MLVWLEICSYKKLRLVEKTINIVQRHWLHGKSKHYDHLFSKENLCVKNAP
jgi:hypothetical protein